MRTMHRRISSLFIAAGMAAAQQGPLEGSPQAAPQQSAPAPTFRTGTELVQVSVVAQDKEGKPVTDLRRDEFQLLDNGAPQELQLFVAETEKSNTSPPQTTAPNTFTNRIAPGSGPRSGYSVIVFDTLFTDFACETGGCGTVWAAQKAVKMLRMLPPGDNIAIYATGYKLWLVRDFTTDTE